MQDLRPRGSCLALGSVALAAVALLHGPVDAQAPPGYYSTVDTSSPSALRQTVHEVIDDHVRYPYTSSSTDTWSILEQADTDPGNAGNILDVYRNASYAKFGGGNSFYNREHTWPKSFGFPNDNSGNYPYTDCHHLFLCDSGYNTSRSNKPYRFCSSACTEKITDVNNGHGGGSGTYPGNSSWTSGSLATGTWETWIGRRGDVARALFYLDVRYEGGLHAITAAAEPDLILTDDQGLISASNTGSNESVAYMGLLSVLLTWHQQDPVDAMELARNDAVYGFQGNRNPFIDHPEWVDCVFGGNCGGGTPPGAPTGLVAAAGNGVVDLDWSDNVEPDLTGYNVYRATLSGGPYTRINGALVPVSAFTDTSVVGGVTYWYTVTAENLSTQESAMSAEAVATPTGGGGAPPWINEFHYDNTGSDTGEFVEIAGPMGSSLSGWQLLGYNGNGGTVYQTVILSGSIPDQQNGFGTLAFTFSGLQNGAPDGIALVDDQGAVTEFLSYEGVLTATDGPAAGMTSVDVGASESSGTPVGDSLQLAGIGTQAPDFTWQSPQPDTPGIPNAGQTMGTPDITPPIPPTGLVALGGSNVIDLDWTDNTEPDLSGYHVYRSTTSGGPYARITASELASSAYSDGSVVVGTEYYYVVTALDGSGNESAFGSEASATPVDTTPPAAPSGLAASAADGVVDLDWADNGEPDLVGYNVLRATISGGPYAQLNGAPVTGSSDTDNGVSNGTTYYYVVTAIDSSGNESPMSNEAQATPMAPAVPSAWINELHYDNSGKDQNEFVEVAGTAGLNLSGWQLLAYNGSNGAVYRTVNLSGTLADQQSGFGTQSFLIGLQNGAPDGIALVDPNGTVVQFLSYEGTMTAADGPAAGMTTLDIGVSEPSSTPVGYSLQLTGIGSAPQDFIWQPPQADSPGQVNAGQTLL